MPLHPWVPSMSCFALSTPFRSRIGSIAFKPCPPQTGMALAKAASLKEPATVEVVRAPTVVRNETELDAFLADLRAEAKLHLDDSKTVIL